MKTRFKVLIVIAAILGVGALAVFIVAPDTRPLTDKVRAESGSDFLKLSEGFTEIQIAGPEGGDPVILVHGLSVPMFDFDRQFEDLADRGFRVLRYNQYGRGLSDRPRGPYDADRYVWQLREIAESQGWDRVHLVGHSMGCLVAMEFAVRWPEAVDRIVLVSPVLHLADGNSGIALARIPVVGDLASKVAMAGVLASRADQLFVDAGSPRAAEYSQRFREQTRYRGFTRSVKSLFRGEVVDDMTELYQRLDTDRVSAVWGSEDESVSTAHRAQLADLLAGADVAVLDGVGHMPTMQSPRQLSELVAGFLGQ